MTQPTAYAPSTDFSGEEAASMSGRSTVRTAQLDAELAAVSITTGQIISNLSLVQRGDNELQDQIVKTHALHPDVLALLGSTSLNPRGTWVTATAYAAKDIVDRTGTSYICVTAHTSGTFATDLAAGKWMTLTAAGSSTLAQFIAVSSTTPTSAPSATGGDSVAIGNGATAPGGPGYAIGNSNAGGDNSFAAVVGSNSSSYGAQALNSIAIGYQAKVASGASGAVAIGGGAATVAAGTKAVVIGGDANQTSAAVSAILGGSSNTIGASSSQSAIICGSGGIINNSATYSALVCALNGEVQAGVTTSAGIFCSDSSKVGANNSAALAGSNLRTRLTGQVSWGAQVSVGDGQASHVVAQGVTTNATPTSIYARTSAGTRLLVANNSTAAFTALIVARRTDVVGEAAAYEIKGLIANNAGTTAIVGAITKTVIAESDASWDATIVADNTNDAIDIQVTGAAAKTIKWAANVLVVEIGLT